MRIKVKLSAKGQILIPKVLRESIGLRENRPALLEIRDNAILIRPVGGENLIAKTKQRAQRHGGNVSKWIYGDRLYEEVFG